LAVTFLAVFLLDEALLVEDWAAAGGTEGKLKLKTATSTAIRIRSFDFRTDGKR
jgi:hypothetical protein